jgi:hypothetical protein
MSSGLSDAANSSVLNHMFATGTYAKPTGLLLLLYTGDPHAAGAVVNVTTEDTAYVAQSITFDDEGVTTNNRVHNSSVITFPAVVYGTDAAAYDVTHWVVTDGSAAFMAGGAFPVAISRIAGQPLAFNAGALYIDLSRTA